MILMDRVYMGPWYSALSFNSNFFSIFTLFISFERVKHNALSITLVSGRRSYFFCSKFNNPSSYLQLRKSPAIRCNRRFLLSASTMVPGKCNSQEKLSDRRIRNLRQVLQLRRRCPTARIGAAVLNMICGGQSAPGEEKGSWPNNNLLLCALCNNKSLTR